MNGRALLSVVSAFLLTAVAGGWSVAHSDARGRRVPNSSGRHASITEGLDCNTCHTAASWKTMSGGDGARGFDHGKTGFPLTGRHTEAGCTDCHHSDVRVRRECSSCHHDEHNGSQGSDCAACHSPASWQMASAIELHRSTRLPLTGVHALLDCATCHRAPAGKRFVSAPSDCVACHLNDMRNPDVHPSHLGDADSPPFPRDCALCHQAHAWSPAVADPAVLRGGVSALRSGLSSAPDHDLRFAISFGAHRGLNCNDCHSSVNTAPQALRCAGCHAHSPVNLATQHQGRVTATAPQACLSCHPGGQAR